MRETTSWRSWRQLEVRGTCSTNEVEVSQHISRKIKSFAVQQEADLQYRFFLNGSLHPHGLTRHLCCRRWGFTGLWRGPRHGDGDSGGCRRARPFFFGPGSGEGRGRTTGGCHKYNSELRYRITTNRYPYPVDSSSCALRLRTSRWPCGTGGKAPVNSALCSEELSRRFSPLAPSPACELTPSMDSLLP
jgi:hypothetical protein